MIHAICGSAQHLVTRGHAGDVSSMSNMYRIEVQVALTARTVTDALSLHKCPSIVLKPYYSTGAVLLR